MAAVRIPKAASSKYFQPKGQRTGTDGKIAHFDQRANIENRRTQNEK